MALQNFIDNKRAKQGVYDSDFDLEKRATRQNP